MIYDFLLHCVVWLGTTLALVVLLALWGVFLYLIYMEITGILEDHFNKEEDEEE